MATIWAGDIQRDTPNIGGLFGEGFTKGMEKQQADEDAAFAAVLKMYQDASPEDQDLLASSPGWSKVVDKAVKLGIPMVPTKSGKMGFAPKAMTIEQQAAEEAKKFPGQPGGADTTALPPGVAGYTARQEALKASATGDLQKNMAQTGYYKETARLLDPELKLKQNENEWKKKVAEGSMSQEELRTKILQQQADTTREEARSQGMFRTGTLAMEARKLFQDAEQFKEKQKLLSRELDIKGLEKREKSLTQYDNWSKRNTAYKTDLRQQLKMADRTQTINQIFNDYHGYKQTVDPSNPLEVAGLQGATTDVMLTLVDELVKTPGGDSELEKMRLTNYLDTIQAAAAQGLIPDNILTQIQATLKAAGYSQKKGKWVLPDAGGGGWFSSFGGGGTP